MNKKFLSNLIFLITINLIVKPFYLLGIDAGVQNAVGAKEYGLYFALFNLSFLLNIVSDMGITNFNNRNISQNRQLLTKHFSNLISLRIILIGFYISLTMIVGWYIGYSHRMMSLLLLILFNQALASFILFLRSNLAGLHLFKSDSIISVLDRFILIFIVGYTLWFGNIDNFKIEWFIWFQTISYFITALIAFIMVRKNLNWFKISLKKLFSISIIKQSLPYALLTLLMGLYHRMDSIMLERMIDDDGMSSGVYAQGFRFLDALNNFSFLFAILLLPIFARMLKEKMDLNPVILSSSKILLSGVLILSITACYYSLDIMQWRYDENVIAAASTFSVLIISSIFFASVIIFGTLLTADGKLKELNYIAVSGVIMNLILNLVLIPKQHELGSAIATLITQGVVAIAHVIVAVIYFKMKVNWMVILKLIILTTVMILMGEYFKNITDTWIVNAAIIASAGLLLALSIKLINPFNLIELVKSNKQQ